MKEKSLAVSKRDLQLLSILVAVVVLFILYFFLAGPAFDESKRIKENILVSEDTLQRMNDTIAQAPQMKQQIDDKRSELQEKYQLFHYEINEARLLYQIDGIMTATNFIANNIQHAGRLISNVSVAQSGFQPSSFALLDLAKKLNPDLSTREVEEIAEDPAGQQNEVNLANSVEQMDITIGFSNTGYQVLYNFIAALEGLERSYLLSDISVGQGEGAVGLQGQILLKTISLPKINEADADDLLFQPIIPQGRTSPF